VTTGRPSGSWRPPGTRVKSDVPEWHGRSCRSRVRLDRLTGRIELVHVRIRQHPIVCGHDAKIHASLDERCGHTCPVGQLIRAARVHGERMICPSRLVQDRTPPCSCYWMDRLLVAWPRRRRFVDSRGSSVMREVGSKVFRRGVHLRGLHHEYPNGGRTGRWEGP
jgi:hypothetical protein